MEGHTDMEILRTVKGSSTGEVNVHLVARDSAGPHPQLPTTAFIIPSKSGSGVWRVHTCSRCGWWVRTLLVTLLLVFLFCFVEAGFLCVALAVQELVW